MPDVLAIILTAVVVGLIALVAWMLLAPTSATPPALARHAVPPPDGPQRSMYERLGPAAIRAAVDQFYHRVLGDPMLARYFSDLSPEGLSQLHRHQALLIGQVLGGPKHYEMHQLAAAHRRLRIDPDSYWRTVGHLAAVLSNLDVDKDIVMHLLDTCFDIQYLICTDGPVPVVAARPS